jgi:putative SAM-dependent methyltransferase
MAADLAIWRRCAVRDLSHSRTPSHQALPVGTGCTLRLQVLMVERNPLMFALLADGLRRARVSADSALRGVADRMLLVSGNAASVIGCVRENPICDMIKACSVDREYVSSKSSPTRTVILFWYRCASAGVAIDADKSEDVSGRGLDGDSLMSATAGPSGVLQGDAVDAAALYALFDDLGDSVRVKLAFHHSSVC